MPNRLWIAWSAAALTLGLLLAYVVIDQVARPSSEGRIPVYIGLILVAAVFTPTVVALVILRSRPTNRIGWIMALGPLPIAVLAFCEAYSQSGATQGSPLPGHVWFGLVSVSLWPAFYIWPVAIALLFPDGHLPSPRWRPAAIVTLGAPVLVVMGVALGTERLEPPQGSAENPLYVGEWPALTAVFWRCGWRCSPGCSSAPRPSWCAFAGRAGSSACS